jgi:hypothetical protein
LEASPCASTCGYRRRLAVRYSQLRCASGQHECMIHLYLSSGLGSKTKRIRTRRLQSWRCKQVHLPMMHEKAVREHYKQRFSQGKAWCEKKRSGHIMRLSKSWGQVDARHNDDVRIAHWLLRLLTERNSARRRHANIARAMHRCDMIKLNT